MKSKICLGVLVAALVVPVRSYALLGEDLVVLWQIVKQGTQMIEQGHQAYEQTRMAAAFVRSPGAWKGMLANAASGVGSVLGKPSTGRDLVALQQITAGRESALETIRQISQDSEFQPTAENAAALSALHMQTVDATVQMNQLQANLDYQQRLQQYRSADPGFGQTIQEMNTWHLKQ